MSVTHASLADGEPWRGCIEDPGITEVGHPVTRCLGIPHMVTSLRNDDLGTKEDCCAGTLDHIVVVADQ